MGRFEDDVGGSINVAVTKTYGPRDPFEIILIRSKTGDLNPSVIHRVVLDWINQSQAQGESRGLHGEKAFREETIKDFTLTSYPREFTSAGRMHVKIECIVKEYRYLTFSYVHYI